MNDDDAYARFWEEEERKAKKGKKKHSKSRGKGKNKRDKNGCRIIDITVPYSGDETDPDEYDFDYVDKYDYNDDIITFLVMGIDKMDEEVSSVYGEINGGQADALFLVVFNPHDKTTKIIGIREQKRNSSIL